MCVATLNHDTRTACVSLAGAADTLFTASPRLAGPLPAGVSALDVCKRLLAHFRVDDSQYQIGRTRLFFRAGILGQLEEAAARMQRCAAQRTLPASVAHERKEEYCQRAASKWLTVCSSTRHTHAGQRCTSSPCGAWYAAGVPSSRPAQQRWLFRHTGVAARDACCLLSCSSSTWRRCASRQPSAGVHSGDDTAGHCRG